MATKRVLVIEDAETLALFIRKRLLCEGETFTVERAFSPRNGHGQRWDGRYDLVLANLEGRALPLQAAVTACDDAHPVQVSPRHPEAEIQIAFPPQGNAAGENQELNFDGVRMLTVLVADVEHSTPLTRSLGPQGMLEFLKAFYAEMIRSVGPAGCTKQYAGDQVLALFEEPLAAVRCALRMRGAFAELCSRWRAHTSVTPGLGVGIATGMVAGDAGRHQHVLAGTPVIVAARLSTLSKGDGAILMDESTYRAVRGEVPAARQARPRTVKGFDAPLQLYRVMVDSRLARPAAEGVALVAASEDVVQERGT